MSGGKTPGLVGGIFLYSLKDGSVSRHDEIDFELLTNFPDRVQTNIYGNEDLGVGHTELNRYPTGSMIDEHVYEIKWTHDDVNWSIDGLPLRRTAEHIPAGPMRIFLNIWAPDAAWPAGHNVAVQPAGRPDDNRVLDTLCVASVTVTPLKP
jgi:beta-glucanase (GH16 family)